MNRVYTLTVLQVFSLPKFFELLLKSRIFSLTADLIFQFFVGEAWGERRIIFWKFKEHQNYDLCLYVLFLHCKVRG